MLWLILGIGLSACSPETSHPSIESWDNITQAIPITHNDFSQLNRELVYWPLNYQECVLKNGTGSSTTAPEDPTWHTCKDDTYTYTFSDQTPQSPLESYSYDTNRYHIDEEKNSQISLIFENIHLPLSEQNSLIELFATTGTTNQKPNINKPNPDLIRNTPRSKPKLTVSGDFTKDFQVQRTKNGLHIQKTSERKDESELFMPTWNGIDLPLWSLRKPDTVYIRAYEEEKRAEELPTTTEMINTMLRNKLAKKQTLQILSYWEEAHYDENDNYIGQETDLYITIDLENMSYQDYGFDPKLCFDTFCFDPKKPIKNYKNRYLQSFHTNSEEEESTTLVYNAALELIIKIDYFFMNSRISRKHAHPDYNISQQTDYSCMDTERAQTVLTHKELQLPQTLNFLGESYTLQDTTFDQKNEDEDYGSYKNFFHIFEDKQAAEAQITEHIKKTGILFEKYFLRFKAHPNLTLIYTKPSDLQTPEAVFYSQEPLIMDEKWYVHDLKLSKTIYCTMGQRGVFLDNTCWEKTDFRIKALHDSLWLSEEKMKKADLAPEWNPYSNDSIIFNSKILPLYNIQKSPVEHYYYIYPASGVEFAHGAGGCKPVIYTYDQQERANELTITLPEKSSFTTLIPSFTKNTTWEFSTDKNSNITVNAEQFPYLYYSTFRWNYRNNNFWWSVDGKDIPHFLEHKLNAMNFNQQEKADFLEYWLPEFDPAFVYTISFKFNEAFEPYAKLSWKHTPEKSFRVFMEAHQHPQNTHISYDPRHPDTGNSYFLKRFERGSNFDMLERGGNLTKLKKT